MRACIDQHEVQVVLAICEAASVVERVLGWAGSEAKTDHSNEVPGACWTFFLMPLKGGAQSLNGTEFSRAAESWAVWLREVVGICARALKLNAAAQI